MATRQATRTDFTMWSHWIKTKQISQK